MPLRLLPKSKPKSNNLNYEIDFANGWVPILLSWDLLPNNILWEEPAHLLKYSISIADQSNISKLTINELYKRQKAEWHMIH